MEANAPPPTAATSVELPSTSPGTESDLPPSGPDRQPDGGAGSGFVAINLAIELIKNDDLETFTYLMGTFPLEQLNPEETSTLLNFLLSTIAGYDRARFLAPLWAVWREKVYPDENTLPLFAWLFTEPLINVPTLQYIAAHAPELTYMEVMSELIHYDASELTVSAARRALETYGGQTRLTYETLQELAEDRDNMPIYNYLTRLIEATAPYAPVPDWVKNFLTPGSTEPPLASQLKLPQFKPPRFELLSPEEAAELLMAGLAAEPVGFEVTRDGEMISTDNRLELIRSALIDQYTEATPEERIAILKPVYRKLQLVDLQSDVELFRILGPAHALIDATVDQDDRMVEQDQVNQLEYGGCRMFTCDIWDFDEETGYVEDWFRGFCDQCHQRIRVRWHAVRVPYPYGGWFGCYCSFDCIRQALQDPTSGIYTMVDEYPNLSIPPMVDYVESQMRKHGIQDRRPDLETTDEVDEPPDFIDEV